MELTKETFDDFINRLHSGVRGDGVKEHWTRDAIFVVQKLKRIMGIARGLGSGCFKRLHPAKPLAKRGLSKSGRKLRTRKKYRPRKDWRQMEFDYADVGRSENITV